MSASLDLTPRSDEPDVLMRSYPTKKGAGDIFAFFTTNAGVGGTQGIACVTTTHLSMKRGARRSKGLSLGGEEESRIRRRLCQSHRRRHIAVHVQRRRRRECSL